MVASGSASDQRTPPANEGGSKKMLVRSLGWKDPWRRTWQPHQYSCLENRVDSGAWQATLLRVTKSDMTEAANIPETTGRVRLGMGADCGSVLQMEPTGLGGG